VDGYDGFEPTRELQASVHRDLARIVDYGEVHSREYGGSWLEARHNYAVSFSGSVEEHEAALAADLELPERLQVRACIYSYAQLKEIQTAIAEEEMGRDPVGVTLVGVDVRRNVVRVGVLLGHTDVEQRLNDRYGPTIAIEEGRIAQKF
jgi:hypothetical protein